MPIKSNKLKTFGTSTKTKSSSSLKKLKADRATFARLVIVAKARNNSMRTILSAALAGSDEQSIAKKTKIEIYTAVDTTKVRFIYHTNSR